MDDIQLGALISVTYRSQFVWINSRMRGLGLSAGQFFVLMVLSRYQGVTQDSLAWKLLIDKGRKVNSSFRIYPGLNRKWKKLCCQDSLRKRRYR